MTLRPFITTLIVFDPPIKVPIADNNLVKGVCIVKNRVMIIHDYGYSDEDYVSDEIKELIKKRIDETKSNDINVR